MERTMPNEQLLEIPHAKRVRNRIEELVLLTPAVYEQLKYCDIIRQYDGTYIARWPNHRKKVNLNELGPWSVVRYIIEIH
jgi:hypothetical protein